MGTPDKRGSKHLDMTVVMAAALIGLPVACSSNDSGCTRGVTRAKSSITEADTVLSRWWSGRITSAWGHSRRARPIGIPERTPLPRAR